MKKNKGDWNAICIECGEGAKEKLFMPYPLSFAQREQPLIYVFMNMTNSAK